MGSTNVGNQILTYDYRQDVIAIGFNRLNYKLHPKGIYQGGGLTKISDSQANILPMVCLYDYQSGTTGLTTRIETLDAASVSGLSPSSPYIIGRFTWINTEDNFMDFEAATEADLQDDWLIFGRAIYAGAVMQTTFDYSRATYAPARTFGFYDPLPFYVTPNTTAGGYNLQVKVGTGGPVFFNGKFVELTTEQVINISSAASTGRTDIIYVDSADNSIGLAIGSQVSGAPLPIIRNSYLPIAIIEMPPNATVVRGDYIKYIHPYSYLSQRAIFMDSSTAVGSIWVS
ncbi:MAG: hypothetical protein AB7V16_07450 [Vulcanibacillus sp.]